MIAIFHLSDKSENVIFENDDYKIIILNNSSFIDTSLYSFRGISKSGKALEIIEIKKNLRIPSMDNCAISSLISGKNSVDFMLRYRDYIDRPSEK